MALQPQSRAVVALVTSVLVLLAFAGCSDTTQPTTPSTNTNNTNITVPAGYQVSVFAKGTSAYSNPDSVVADATHVYVGYQNVTAKDGTDNKTSTVVEYTLDGKVVKTFDVPGHCDGLRLNPDTHLLWATSNEDGNPRLVTIDPTSGTITPYQLPPTPHGGGYDDMAFLNGMAFIAASNPTLNAAGVNVFPALAKVQLSGGTATLTPVLMGNATALDTTTNQTVTLNEVDPDSLSIDPQGDLVLVDQAGNELVFLSSPGTPQQQVTRVPVGTQLDDTVWATSTKGRMLVADGKHNTIYALRTTWSITTIYTEAPDDSGVANFLGTVALKTGFVTPFSTGYGKATGLYFLPDA